MKKKSINKIILIALGLILVLSFININIFNYIDDYYDKNNQYLRENLELSDYSSSIEGSGEDINITLHQSLMNTTNIEFSNLDTANTFIESCPSDPTFNSSFINVTIEDIKAPDRHIIVENDSIWGWQDARQIFVSFEVQGIGYLENISAFMRQLGLGTHNYVDFYILTAEDVSGKLRPVDSSLTKIYDDLNVTTTPDWYNATDIHYKFNCSNTINNTYFLYTTYSEPGTANWGYNPDIEGDGVNESIVLDSSENPIIIPLIVDNTIDLLLEIDVAPYIYPSSKELIVEDDTLGDGFEIFFLGEYYVSFKIKLAGYIENISMLIKNATASKPNLTIKLYNASDSGGIPYPDTNLGLIVPETEVPLSSTYFWYTFNNTHAFYNSSKTYNNTFFLHVEKWGAGAVYWDWYSDGADADETYVYDGAFQLETFEAYTIDLGLKIGVAPLENVPRPKNIGLKINNTAVIGFSDIYGSGYWSSTEVYSSSSDQMEFELSADWWDVSCKITKVLINYTKTDLKASSKFTNMESGQDVQWNVTRSGGLNFFDPRITHHNTINFTIPATWLNINAFNGPENKTSDIKTRLLNNGYRDVEIIDAINGTFWYLTATSKNLVESIDIYTGSNPISMANYSDVVKFNVTFNKIIGQNDGIINLCVYSPAAINDKLNFTSVNSTFDSGSEFYLGKWDISNTVTEYGEFRIHVFWNNDTAAGFREKILTITGQTDLILVNPCQEATCYYNQSFNIVVFYKDSNQLKAIDGATIQYNINGQGWQSTSSNSGAIGLYIIPVNCSIFPIDGTKTVEITASKNYYESQMLNYNFNVIIVEEKGKPAGEFPLAIIIITITSIAGGIGVVTVTLVLLRKRKRISKGI